MFERVEFRNDDVFINSRLTPSMIRSLRTGSMFDKFKETDKFFAEKNIPCILAVLADGIDENLEWVNYVKSNLHRFQVEMHGYHHTDYRNFDVQTGMALLKLAKEKIERTFGTKVTRWYVPFGSRAFPEWGPKVCEQLGIGFNNSLKKLPHFRFHFWNSRDVEKIKIIAKKYGF